MKAHYRIGEFADLAGVSAKTLRFYDEIDVLRPASIDCRTGYRFYLPRQLEDLASILALKSLGMSLAQVRELNGKRGSACARKAMLMELRSTLERSLRTAARSLNCINVALEELEESRSPISIVVKRRPAIPIASMRIKPKNYADVSDVENELWRSLPSECIGGLRGVLWHRCADSGPLEAEPFIALKRRVPTSTSCELSQLPQATLACAYSDPDDSRAEVTYGAIRRWMQTRGYGLAGPKRELNLGQMLEIQFPLMEEQLPSP
jgi:DNA-binding transcriptional MerR regulator